MTDIHVERYCMTLNKFLTIGKAGPITLGGSPTIGFTPKVFTANLAEPGLVSINEFMVDGVSIFREKDIEIDLYTFNAAGYGKEVDMPKMSPASIVVLKGWYTGKRPKGAKRWWEVWRKTIPLIVACSFKGPVST